LASIRNAEPAPPFLSFPTEGWRGELATLGQSKRANLLTRPTPARRDAPYIKGAPVYDYFHFSL